MQVCGTQETSPAYLARDMGGCQNYGPFLGTLNTRCRTILGTQKGTLILTTTTYRQTYIDTYTHRLLRPTKDYESNGYPGVYRETCVKADQAKVALLLRDGLVRSFH